MKIIQGSETVRYDHVEVNMFTYLPDVFPISSDFYSWMGHWQMKIYKSQTRASCCLIANSNALLQTFTCS